MLEYFDFLLPSSPICESLKSQFPPTQLSQALKDYHDKTHYAATADFYHRYYFYTHHRVWDKVKYTEWWCQFCSGATCLDNWQSFVSSPATLSVNIAGWCLLFILNPLTKSTLTRLFSGLQGELQIYLSRFSSNVKHSIHIWNPFEITLTYPNLNKKKTPHNSYV